MVGKGEFPPSHFPLRARFITSASGMTRQESGQERAVGVALKGHEDPGPSPCLAILWSASIQTPAAHLPP